MKRKTYPRGLRTLLGVLLLPLLAGLAHAQTETYRYFRFTQTGVNAGTTNGLRGNGGENSIQLAEFQMRFGGATIPGAVATNPGRAANSPAGEPPSAAVDNNLNTKWLDFAKAPLVLDFGSPVTADGYRFGTANDSPDRDPISWILEGSDDNATWTQIHAVENNPTTTARRVYDYEFLFTNPPRILLFERFQQIVPNGTVVDIDYDVLNATLLEVDNSVGELDFNDFGDFQVTPPSNTDTVYTLTATNEDTSTVSTATTTVRSVTQTEHTYQYVRFTPVRLRETIPGNGTANSIQLAEFEFFLGGTAVVPTAATNPGGNNPPAGTQNVGNLINQNYTDKWLDFNKSFVIFDFGAPETIDGYKLTTANDAPERDPVAWTLEGSNDQTSWTLIDAIVTLSTDPAVEFNYLLPSGRGVTSDEIPLPGSVSIGPASIGSFTATPVIVADGSSTNLTWTTAFSSTLSIDNGVGEVFGESGTESVMPPANTDTTFTLTVDNVLAMPDTASTFVRSVTQGSVSYRYVRFVPIRLAEFLPEFGVSNSIQLAEFDFYNGGTALDLTALGTVVTNPDGNFPANEGPANLIDNDTNTKWLDFNKSAVVFDFGSAQTFNGYQWTTANDAGERDPIAWRLDGSSDGVTWTNIDHADRDRSNPEEFINFFYSRPRFTATQIIPVPDPASLAPLAPDITLFVADAPNLVSGKPLVLTWETDFGATATINDGTGPVSVPVEGAYTANPTADTTYTLTVTGPGGTSTAQTSIVVVNPTITEICYDDFDTSSDELTLIGAAAIVNDFATLPNPGDFARLRLTGITGSQNGTAWFRSRVDTSGGFDTSFAMHFPSGTSDGADGMAFILQNNPAGTGLSAGSENGLGSDALNVGFDSYLNAPEPSAAMVRVSANGVVLQEVDLTTIAALGITDLSQTNDSTPYNVQIGCTSTGLLSVYINDIPVIVELAVDLEAIGAVDASGTGYVGFGARTGGSFEAHDITSWCFLEQEPVFPIVTGGDIEIVDFSVNLTPGSQSITLTWTSSPGVNYNIVSTSGGNLANGFTQTVSSGIASGGATTTQTVPFTPSGTKEFFRIEEAVDVAF